ncbi:hypothetical protein KXD40_005520 [Peronospora effusa]|nr:hypothetical protein KXD40_005520 [Peronospora effusa]
MSLLWLFLCGVDVSWRSRQLKNGSIGWGRRHWTCVRHLHLRERVRSSVIFIQYWVLTCYTNESYVIFSTHTAEPGTLHPRSRGFSRLA